MVIPGCPWMNDRASTARVLLPLRLPARRLVVALACVAAFALAGEPRGRPGPRRVAEGAGALLTTSLSLPVVGTTVASPTLESAAAAASRRAYSSTSGLSSL